AEARVRDAAWCGALRFYVAQAGAERLAKHLLQAQVTSPLRNGLFQAASWISEAPDDGEWRRQTLILLGQLTRQRTFAQVLRQRAAAALVQTGESGRWAFVQQLLERSDPFMRRCGVVALSHLGLSDPAQAVELLTALQKDGDGLVRQLSVTALAWLATPQAEKPLLAALIEGDDVMRQAAAEGLARMGREGSEILREALEDESIAVRVAAVRAMAHMEAPWVAQTLSQVERQDAEWMVRGAASDVIVELEARDKVQPWLPLQPRGLRWLVNLATREGRVVPEGEAARPFLVQVMAQTTDPAVRAAAALALGQLPDPQVLPALETAVRESDPLVQEAAFVTFCQIDRAFGT
ncbi:MAG: HEAT repeat domain-containing protein, partial [Anaerolineales bacterium]|nr:HEAT repeat domain-containing protein [Anaerolineales bacterium]